MRNTSAGRGRRALVRLQRLGLVASVVLGGAWLSGCATSVDGAGQVSAASTGVTPSARGAGRAAPKAAGAKAASVRPEGFLGSGACAACHADISKAFAKTSHGRAPGWAEEHGCESCHGPGQPHVSNPADRSAIARLGALPAAEASKPCATCHEGSAFASSSHDGLDTVGCTSCHAAHVTSKNMLRMPEVDLCSSCHAAAAAQFALPRTHPMSRTGSACVSCHPAHGGASTMAKPADTCTLSCHAPQRGPFIYPHDVGLLDGCVSCHEPHGSTNRHLLKHARQVDLCYSCHPGANTPTFHSFGRFLGEKCTACHTAIHGSNTSSIFLED